MTNLDALRQSIPDSARDVRLNLQTVLTGGTLTAELRWGVALASAVASRHAELTAAVLADAEREASAEVVEDALAAAAVMAMNNVYYRFRHLVGKESYSQKPARLRMNKLAQPASSKLNLELFALAVSAINNCETCVRSHEQVVVDGGLTEDQVHDAIRIASVIQAAAVALELPKRKQAE